MHVCFLSRNLSSGGPKQLNPTFGGFISAAGSRPAKKPTKDFFTPIDQPFTDFGVVRELLERFEEAIDAVEQQYLLNIFDLGGCMKALPIIWRNP